MTVDIQTHATASGPSFLDRHYRVLMLYLMMLQTVAFGICVWLDWLILKAVLEKK